LRPRPHEQPARRAAASGAWTSGHEDAAEARAARRAIALAYDPARDAAPVVTAAGEGLVADEIVRRAREAGVTISENEQLAAVLGQLDVGTIIPPELYLVVAEVLADVYRLEAESSEPSGGEAWTTSRYGVKA
jgi:flagellar biosynthesis protein